jgi:hypothetical protein
MSTGLTGNYSFPYPVPTDPVNVSGDIEKLASKIDNDLQEIVQDTSALMWTTGGTFSNGIQTPTYNDTTGKMSMSLSQDIQSSASPTFVNLTLAGDLSINGGDVATSQTTFNFVNSVATTLNVGGDATAINIGNSFGKTNFAGDVNIATGKVFEINSVAVLSSSALGSSIVSSSLTSVGTITTGTWNATTIAVNKGGTGLTSYATGDLVYASASTTLTKLAIGSENAVLTSNGSLPTWTTNTGTGNVVRAESPALSGIPTAPTATSSTNTTQIATTQFVQTAIQAVEALPSQTGQSGKYLTTNGTVASWGTIDFSPYAALSGAIFTGTVNVSSPTAAGSKGVREITMSTSNPSGGADGDVWIVYA